METWPQVLSAEGAVERYADMVYRLALARTGAASDADDVFQEVFLRYCRRRPVFDSEEHRKAWLLRVTLNCAKKHWSTAWMRKTEPLTEALAPESPEETGLTEALSRLSPRYRTVVHLYYYEGYSAGEIGRLTGRRESTVRAQLARARARLSELLKGDLE